MKLIKFTRYVSPREAGQPGPVYVNPQFVAYVFPSSDPEKYPSVLCFSNGYSECVMEPIAEVASMLTQEAECCSGMTS